MARNETLDVAINTETARLQMANEMNIKSRHTLSRTALAALMMERLAASIETLKISMGLKPAM
jgi:NitT/TauT family transport system substrate-binding protein